MSFKPAQAREVSAPVEFTSVGDGQLELPRNRVRFLILTQYFPPEIGGAPTRLRSVAAELSRAGHEVEVLTGFPNYPHGKMFAGYEKGFYRRERRDGITIHRVWMHPAIGSGFQRMLNYGSFALMSLIGFLRVNRPNYIFVESPPLFLGIPAYLAGALWGTPFIFNVSDIWPDFIVEGGFLKDGFLVKCMRLLEAWSYRQSLFVNAVTEGIRRDLLTKKSLPPEKVLFLPNGADTKLFQPTPPDRTLKAKLGLTEKKIVLWAGTLGLAHGLQHVMHAAKLLEGKSEIHFLFVGDGSAKRMLLRLQKELQLRNVTFLDAVQLDELPPYFSIAEVGLSTLTDLPSFDGARPSKLFPILASGKPVIFAGKGEAARLVQEAKAGLVVPSRDSGALAEAILELTGNPSLAAACGQNGREYVEAHYQWSQVISEWLRQMNSRLEGSATAGNVIGVRRSHTSAD